MTIHELMSIPPEQRDLIWLKCSLQLAAQLEVSTLPPYLCAKWSIQVQSDPVARLLDTIILEEMLHLGYACNLLKGIGGTPVLNTPDVVPTYPGPLPGGVRPQLTVYLAGLSPAYLAEVCMQIEYPESGPVHLFLGETYPTIGAFYEAIAKGFEDLKPSINPNGQVTQAVAFPDGTKQTLTSIKNLDQALNAIMLIKSQGEGANAQDPDTGEFPPASGEELGHYYRFAEIYHGREFVNINGKWGYNGAPILFPLVHPVARVPAGGYPQNSSIVDFDKTYKKLLDDLTAAWSEAGGSLGDAIGTMYSLQSQGLEIVKQPLPDSSHGHYAPDFRLLP